MISFKRLFHYVVNVAGDAGPHIVSAVILPGSFQDSARNMRDKYNDDLVMVTKFGKTNLFITCNPSYSKMRNYI